MFTNPDSDQVKSPVLRNTLNRLGDIIRPPTMGSSSAIDSFLNTPRLTRREFIKDTATTSVSAALLRPSAVYDILDQRIFSVGENKIEKFLTAEKAKELRDIFEKAANGEQITLPHKDHEDDQIYDLDFTATLANALIAEDLDSLVENFQEKYRTDLSYAIAALAGFRAGFLGIPDTEFDQQMEMVAAISIVSEEELNKECGINTGGCAKMEVFVTRDTFFHAILHEIQHLDEHLFNDSDKIYAHSLELGDQNMLHIDNTCQTLAFQNGEKTKFVDLSVKGEFHAELGDYAIKQSFIKNYLGDKGVEIFTQGRWPAYFSEQISYTSLFKAIGDALSQASDETRNAFHQATRSQDILTYCKIIAELLHTNPEANNLQESITEYEDNIPLSTALSIKTDELATFNIDPNTASGIKLLAILSAIARKVLTRIRESQNPNLGIDNSLFMHPISIVNDRIVLESYFYETTNNPVVFDSLLLGDDALEITVKNQDQEVSWPASFLLDFAIDRSLASENNSLDPNINYETFEQIIAARMYSDIYKLRGLKDKPDEVVKYINIIKRALQQFDYKYPSINGYDNPLKSYSNVSDPTVVFSEGNPADIFQVLLKKINPQFANEPGYVGGILTPAHWANQNLYGWIGNSDPRVVSNPNIDDPNKLLYLAHPDKNDPNSIKIEGYNIAKYRDFVTYFYSLFFKNQALSRYDKTNHTFRSEYQLSEHEVNILKNIINNKEILGSAPLILDVLGSDIDELEANPVLMIGNMINLSGIISMDNIDFMNAGNKISIPGYQEHLRDLREKALNESDFWMRSIYAFLWLYTLIKPSEFTHPDSDYEHYFPFEGRHYNIKEYLDDPSQFPGTSLEDIARTIFSSMQTASQT